MLSFRLDKKIFPYTIILASLLGVASVLQAQIDQAYLSQLKHNHDLVSLPDWGPYTKNYIGVSHISDAERGIRFDLSVFPGLYRRKIEVPDVNFESGFHPWETSANLEYFSFRHELEWKDQVYTDISYSKIDEQARLIRIEAVNNTDYPQSIVMHMMGSIHFPPKGPYAPNLPLRMEQVKLPNKGYWVEAIDYSDCHFTTQRPTDNLIRLGMMRGEYTMHDFVKGAGIHFGEQGDQLTYQLEVKQKLADARLIFRYRLIDDRANQIRIRVGEKEQTLRLPVGKALVQTASLDLGILEAGTVPIVVSAEGVQNIDFDGFALIEKAQKDALQFIPSNWDYVAELTELPEHKAVMLKYPDIDTYYGIKWEYEDYEVREWYFSDLSHDFRRRVHNHTMKVLKNGTEGHFTNVFLRPIALEPQSTEILYAQVYSGTKQEVLERVKASKLSNKEGIYTEARKSLLDTEQSSVPAAKPYLFGYQMLAANALGGLVYPIYTQKQQIKHYSPGRYWDILYTWDSGFTGLGLAQLDDNAAIEILNTYVNEPDEQSAFIQHGSFVPVQHYLFLEIWNKTHSEEYLRFFYPKLKAYYDFYVGKSGSSTTAKLNSGLLQTWDYFYNSGGWDDYPPQKYSHQQKIAPSVAPVVNSAHGIRIAKIMKQAAIHLGFTQDVKAYDQDIAKLSEALQAHAWDEASGYYGYVRHDESTNPIGILKYQDSVNFNMGLGGAYPLVSDICTPEQQAALLENLRTEGRIWSKIGLSAVDQQAPYYSREGYWNGSVWMPHQWFFWKAMFDYGESDFAFKIAKTALDLWKKETERTYNSYEHFMIETETGAGWHQFSGLSSPVLAWFNAYFKKGTLTTGYDAWVSTENWNADKSQLETEFALNYDKGERFAVVACMNPDYEYQVYWNGKEVAHETLHAGTLSIGLTYKGKGKAILKITTK